MAPRFAIVMSVPPRVRRGVVAGMVSLLSAASGAAQQGLRPAASPFLAADDWAVTALRRLDALGLLESPIDVGDRTPSIADVERATREAVIAARQADPGILDLALGYRARFEAEYPRFDGFPRSAFAFGRAQLDWVRSRGDLVPGRFETTIPGNSSTLRWVPPAARPDVSEGAVLGRLAAQLGPGLSVSASPRLQGGETSFEELYAVAGWRGLGAWAGRRPVGFGPALGGGVVLSGYRAFDGGGIFLREPGRLPSILRHLGHIDFQTLLARAEDSGEMREPFFWAARGTLTPHRRLTIGLNRAALFGGEGNAPPTLRNVVFVIVGAHALRNKAQNFENQVASVDVRWRVPTPVPLEVYGEWGFEDNAGAWKDVPGIVAGVQLPALPGLPELSLAVERATFAEKCCGNPEWYSHRLAFWNGWVQDGEPLGHPLAGHGSEWRARSDAALSAARLRVGVDVFTRERRTENILAPTREGSSRGGELRLDLSAGSSASLVARAALERGAGGWEQTDGAVGLRWSF